MFYRDNYGYRRWHREPVSDVRVTAIDDRVEIINNTVTVPKTESIPAWMAYNQLWAMVQDLRVHPSVIEETVNRVGSLHGFPSPVQEELKSVAEYFRWVYGNLHHIRGVYGRKVIS